MYSVKVYLLKLSVKSNLSKSDILLVICKIMLHNIYIYTLYFKLYSQVTISSSKQAISGLSANQIWPPRSHDLMQPIGGQYYSHMMSCSQSEASIAVTWCHRCVPLVMRLFLSCGVKYYNLIGWDSQFTVEIVCRDW